MAEKIKGINITSAIVPFTTDDDFATHYAKYGNGGWREVQTIAERDAITQKRREDGMAVFVRNAVEEQGHWVSKIYIYNATDNSWEVLPTGGSGPSEPVKWGDISGTITNQTDLTNYVEGQIGDTKLSIYNKNKQEDPLVTFSANQTGADLSVDLASSADIIDYTYIPEPSIDNVEGALDFLFEKTSYKKPEILNFTTNLGNSKEYEKGTVKQITEITLSLNKPFQNIRHIFLNNIDLPGWKEAPKQDKSYSYVLETPLSINSDTTYQLKVVDDHDILVTSEMITYNFITYKYYGVSSLEALDDTQIKSLKKAKAVLALPSESFDFRQGAYFYYVVPKELVLEKEPDFYSGLMHMSNNYFIVENSTFTNDAGLIIPMMIYKFKKNPDNNPEYLTGKQSFEVR